MPSIALKLSDLRFPIAIVATLLLGYALGTATTGPRHAEMAGLAVPSSYLSYTPDVTEAAPERSLRPGMRPAHLLLGQDIPTYYSLLGMPCLEQTRKLDGEPITYLSDTCLWYAAIDRSTLPAICRAREAGVDNGRLIYPVDCLIREGFFGRTTATQRAALQPSQ